LKTDPDAPPAFLAFHNLHALAGIVCALTGQTSFANAFPPGLRHALRNAYLEQWTQSESLVASMVELESLLQPAGVDFLFLKGPLFAQRYYGDIDRRLTGDVDLLVRPEAAGSVGALLERAGFAARSRPRLARLAMRFTHHFEYVRDATVVELHWELANHFTYRIDEQRMWAGRRWMAWRSGRFPVPSAEYDLVMQLLTIFKDAELGTIVARAFIDLHQILIALGESFDWAAFLATRAREGLLAISLNMLDLALEVLGAHERFPSLAAALEQHRAKLIGRDRPLKGLDLFTATPPAFANKRRLFWWLASLPWRLSVYRSARAHR
jgi:hypothetical protein